MKTKATSTQKVTEVNFDCPQCGEECSDITPSKGIGSHSEEFTCIWCDAKSEVEWEE